MGVVYAAWDKVFGREVVVKTLLGGRGDTVRAARRFAREARITARLQHPNIPAVHDLGTLPDGRPFLVMKRIRGRTLGDLLREAGDDRLRYVGAFQTVCQAVGYAHEQGVVHRDLKPANVMVGAFAEVQVVDWGLAKVVAAHPPDETTDADTDHQLPDGLTRTGSVVGTVAYIPPEQARGEPVGPAADVFALGATLCELLTGRPTYTGSPSDCLRQAAAGDTAAALDRLREVTDAGTPEARFLARLAARCIAPDAGDRPAGAREVADELERFASDARRQAQEAEVAARTAAERTRLLRNRRRLHRLRTGLIVATVVTCLGMVQLTLHGNRLVNHIYRWLVPADRPTPPAGPPPAALLLQTFNLEEVTQRMKAYELNLTVQALRGLEGGPERPADRLTDAAYEQYRSIPDVHHPQYRVGGMLLAKRLAQSVSRRTGEEVALTRANLIDVLEQELSIWQSYLVDPDRRPAARWVFDRWLQDPVYAAFRFRMYLAYLPNREGERWTRFWQRLTESRATLGTGPDANDKRRR